MSIKGANCWILRQAMMAKMRSNFWVAAVLLQMIQIRATAQLTPSFYKTSCPQILNIVQNVLFQAFQEDSRMPASLLRLHFHDCFVNGCDASILLDATPTSPGEKSAGGNLNSVRGYDVIDRIKEQLESTCPHVVSCADIIAIAAQQSVELSWGPQWDVPLGRRDSLKASLAQANQDLPSPSLPLDQLIAKFKVKGLSIQDLVALSGAHTLGLARCSFSKDIRSNSTSLENPDSNLRSNFVSFLQRQCSTNNQTLFPLDVTPGAFDNFYYRSLVRGDGYLNSDQVLYSNAGVTQDLVKVYSANTTTFFIDFQAAMIKMGNISPLIGANGEIRKNCRVVNG